MRRAKKNQNASRRFATICGSGIKKIFPEAEINGSENESGGGNKTLPNILNVYFPGHAAQDLLVKFDLAGLAVSAGSACRSRAIAASYVIEALGYSKDARDQVFASVWAGRRRESEITAALKIIEAAV